MRNHLSKILGRVSTFALLAPLAWACSSEPVTGNDYGALPPTTTGGGAGSGSALGGSTSAGSTNGGAGGTEAVAGRGGTGNVVPIPTNAGNPGTAGDGNNCGAENHQAMIKPLAIYLLVDWSASMTEVEDLWTPVKTALNTFVSDPESGGIEVALGFFPVENTDQTIKCDATQYVTPSVPVGMLPENAASVTASLDAKTFVLGEIPDERLSTPTAPALTGSLQYFSGWLAEHPDHIGVMVLATDGEPALCPIDGGMGMPGIPGGGGRGTPEELQAAVDAIAAAAAGTPAINTYVIGIGNLMQALDQLAMAGNTGRNAFIVDASGTNTQAEFLAAMKEIRGAALPCSFTVPLPTNGPRDFEKVNVDFQTDPTAMPVPFYKVENAAACAGNPNSWYYDDPLNPTSVQLCEDACQLVLGSDTSNVSISLGCTTRVR